MDEHDVVEAGTDLLFGDPKSVLKKIGLSILDKKQFEAIFVSAGKTVAEYEKDNTEQNDIRRILFCEKTMRLLANEIRKSNSFDWLNDLDRCVNDLLSLSELDSINKARCKKHFEDIVIYQIKKLFPQRYGSYCLGDIHDNVNSLMASTQSSNETLNKILELMVKMMVNTIKRVQRHMDTGRIRVHIHYLNGIWRGWKLMVYLRTKIAIRMILLN